MEEKKSYQRGSIRKRGNKYYYRFRIKMPDGSVKNYEAPGTGSKRETEKMLRDALEEYELRGRISDPGNITLNELMDEWFSVEIEPSSRTTNTIDRCRSIMDHIRSHPIGNAELRSITVAMIQSYVDEKYYGEYDSDGHELKHAYSESSMKEEFLVLNGIFKYAVYPKEYLRFNPMDHVKKRKKPKKAVLFGSDAEKMEIITHEQFLEVVEFLKTHKNSFGDNYLHMLLPVEIAYYTGLRAGELCGLTWEDIDIPGRKLTVRRSMYQDSGTNCWELKTPKNGKQRVVDFGDTLAEILTAAKEKQVRDRDEYGRYYQNHYCRVAVIKGRTHHMIYSDIYTDSGIIGSRVGHGKLLKDTYDKADLIPLEFVCRKEDGEMVTTQTLKNCNKLIQEHLPHIPFHMHGLRHTYGSNMVASGANFKDLQMLMGHSDISITLNVYAHVTERSRKTAVDLLEKSLYVQDQESPGH